MYLRDFGTAGFDRFVSLGSPHNPPPPNAAGVVDQTRGILTAVQESTPGAYHPEIAYTSIAGDFITGAPLSGPGGALARFAGAGYQQVLGAAAVPGDFIVPVAAAHLDGAAQVTLDGVFHSPLGEALPWFGPWYGSEAVLPRWVHYVTGGESEEEGEGEGGVGAEAAAAEAAAVGN